jgi:hypothetical protein
MQDSFTAEQRAEIDAFLADSRTIRFVETDENWTALGTFMDEHSLPTDHASMVFAYESLVKQDALEVIPFREPIPAEPVPAPATTHEPAPQPVVIHATMRTLAMFRNGQPIIGSTRSLL